MLADQWDAQPCIKRIVAELKCRDYIVWIDIEQMSGLIMDAMSEAVESAVKLPVCAAASPFPC